MVVHYLESLEGTFSSTWRHLFLGCERHSEAVESLDRLAGAVKIPTLMDGYDVLLAVVAQPAAHGRRKGAKVTPA